MKLKHVTIPYLSASVAGYVLIATLTLFLFCPTISFGRDVKFLWTYPKTEEAKIEGFRMYDKDHNIVADKIPKIARNVTINYDHYVCSAYFMRAYKKDKESKDSVIAVFCPPGMELDVPGLFHINGTVTLTPNK